MISSKKPHTARKFRSLVFATTSAITTAGAMAAPGDLDTTFVVSPTGGVSSAVTQANGDILLAGNFSLINGDQRGRMARVSPTGVLDGFYNPSANNTALNINILPDGRAFYCGAFNSVNIASGSPQTRTGIARFLSSGGVDSSFNPGLSVLTYTITEQSAGLLLVGTEAGLYRLAATGALEATNTFTRYNGGKVSNLLVRPDLKILIGGAFVNGSASVDRAFFDRVSSIGGPDAVNDPFPNPQVDNEVQASAFQADGGILIGGDFATATVTTVPPAVVNSQRGIVRMTGAGTFDSNFRPVLNGSVLCMAVQADGKILIGGNFNTVSSKVGTVTTTLTRPGIARLNANGTVDPTFDAKMSAQSAYTVSSISLQSDGKILLTGSFGLFNSVARVNIARLQNDPVVSDLRAVNGNTIRWMRGGSAPEVQAVNFEYSFDNASWIPFGAGTRIAGGWETTSTTTLPATCFLRGIAKVTGGTNNGSQGLTTATANYPIPKLAIAQTGGPDLTTGGTTALAPTSIATPGSFPFLLKNVGTGSLNISSTYFTGVDAGLFTITTAPTSPVAGPAGTTPFVVRFAPTTTGPKTAVLNIVSNDPATLTYSVTLTGNAVTDIEAWRYQYFGVTTSTGDAADGADPDGDGQTNLFEYVAGLVPNDKTSRFQQAVDTSSANAKLIFSPRLAGRTYDIESSTTLAAGSWAPATGTTADNLAVRTFTDAAALEPRRFYRVKITKP